MNFSAHFTYGSGMPLPSFYSVEQGHYTLAPLNDVRAPIYERTDVRVNKDYVHQKFNATLYAEIVNVTNHEPRFRFGRTIR